MGMNPIQLKIHQLKCAVHRWGKVGNPKIFFLHGFMDSGACFEPVAKRLEDQFYCLAPDFRGFGQSAWTKDPLGYFFFEYLADIHVMFNKLSPKEPLSLVGHSMGGNIASLYAGVFPERVVKFVNIEGFGIPNRNPQDNPARVKTWIESSSRGIEKRAPKPLTFFVEKIAKTHPYLDEKSVLTLTKKLTVKKGKGYLLAADPKHTWPNPHPYRYDLLETFFSAVRAKSLMIVGEKSPVNHPSLGERLSYYRNGYDLKIIPGAGHMVHYEKPVELAAAIGAWMRSKN